MSNTQMQTEPRVVELGTVPGLAPTRPTPPNPEVAETPLRRRFTAEYKLRILRAADACGPGELAALLRREGLYSSHMTTWRRQRRQGELDALAPKPRGRKTVPRNRLTAENERLRRENARLQQRLKQAETIIECQKKLSDLLGIPRASVAKSEPEE